MKQNPQLQHEVQSMEQARREWRGLAELLKVIRSTDREESPFFLFTSLKPFIF